MRENAAGSRKWGRIGGIGVAAFALVAGALAALGSVFGKRKDGPAPDEFACRCGDPLHGCHPNAAG